MRITPIDIRNHDFPRRMSGYDRAEVDTFLRLVSEDYEAALREGARMRDQISALQARVEELTGSERLLQDTLTSAQRLADDLKQTAMKEAEVLIGQAEIKGEKVLEAAHRRAARLAEDIREMKLMRGRLATGVRAAIDHQLEVLESLTADFPAEDPALEGRIAVLTRTREAKATPES